MKAFIVDKYGKDVPLRAGELPAPVPGEHDVLIAVHAAGVNPIDSKIKAGEFKLILPFKAPFVLGRDLAGVVTAVGSAVRRFAPGDEVYASLGKATTGAFAELVAVNDTRDFATVVHAYDLVLDSLGGKRLEESLRVVRPGGLLIGIGGPPDPDFARQLGKPLLRPVLALLSRKIRSKARRHQVTY